MRITRDELPCVAGSLMKKYNAFHDKLYVRTHGRYSLRTAASDLDNLTDDLFISSSSLELHTYLLRKLSIFFTICPLKKSF